MPSNAVLLVACAFGLLTAGLLVVTAASSLPTDDTRGEVIRDRVRTRFEQLQGRLHQAMDKRRRLTERCGVETPRGGAS